MKYKFVKSFIKHNIKFYLSLILCTTLCLFIFVASYHINSAIADGLYNYIESYTYYDGLIQPHVGDFTEEEVKKIESIDGISSTRKGYIIDSVVKDDNEYRYLRFVITDIKDYEFYKTETGDVGDVYLSASFAKANNYHAGDTITASLNGQDFSFKIKSIINSPEIMGTNRTATYIFPEANLGFAYIDTQDFKKYVDTDVINSIAYYLKDDADPEKVTSEINDIFSGQKSIYQENSNSSPALSNIENDIGMLSPTTQILPFLIYGMGLTITVLFIKQFIDTKLREVGILKSNGVSNTYIISLFVYYALSISIIGSILGIIFASFLSRMYVDVYTTNNFLPTFDISLNYGIVIIAALVSIIINVLAVVLNISKIIKVDILNIINGSSTAKNHHVDLFKNKLIKIKSFSSSLFDKPFRFIFLVISMIFAVILVAGSIGLKEAKDYSIRYIYDEQINYDYIVHYYSYAQFANNMDNSFLEMIAEINGQPEKLYVLNNLDYINLYDIDGQKISLTDGIILSNKIAGKIDAHIGDDVMLNGKKVKVANISKEVTDYKSYIPYNIYTELFGVNTSSAYFVKGDINKYNLNDPNIYFINSTKSLRDDIENKLDYISGFILIIIGISCAVSIIVIFNMSVIYYRERYREHKVLRTLGFSRGKIVILSLMEVVLEASMSLIAGIPLGYYLSTFVVDKISNNNITLYSSFDNMPVLFIIVFIIAVAVLGRIIASHNQIKLVDDNE